MEWRSFNINKNLIKSEAQFSVKIAMPHNSDYDGYTFWHPAKLVRSGRHSAAVSISYTDEWVFKITKHIKRHNSLVLDEIPLAADEMEEIFGVINENIRSKKSNDFSTYKPREITPEQSTEEASLIDNE